MPFLPWCVLQLLKKLLTHNYRPTSQLWCNPKAFKLWSTTLFSGLAGGYCAISGDQRQDGDRLAEPQNAVCDATSALRTRGEILSKGCSCQTAEMELRTIANILQSLARKISNLPFQQNPSKIVPIFISDWIRSHWKDINNLQYIRKTEVLCQRKTMWISIWRTRALLCEACAGYYVEAGGLYRKPSAVKTKKCRGKKSQRCPDARCDLGQNSV